MNVPRSLAAAVAALAIATLAQAAPPEGKGKPANNKKQTEAAAPAQSGNSGNAGKGGKPGGSNGYASGFDEAAFRVYVGQQSWGSYEALPPGIRKNLARGKPLPPGLQSRAVPPELLRRLPVREGYEWRAIGTDLVLYSITSGLVDQVLSDIFD